MPIAKRTKLFAPPMPKAKPMTSSCMKKALALLLQKIQKYKLTAVFKAF